MQFEYHEVAINSEQSKAYSSSLDPRPSFRFYNG